MQSNLRRAALMAATALGVGLMAGGAAHAKTVEMTATEDYAKTVSAVCTVKSPRDAASGLSYFLKAAGVDKEPTKEGTGAFCDAFKVAYPLDAAGAVAVLKETEQAGGAPAPMGKKKKDKDKPPPGGGGGGGETDIKIHFKFGPIEFDIEVHKKPKESEGAGTPAGGDSGSSGGDGGTPGGDNNPPPYNPGPPPE
jgi:hypothetical protein